MKSHEMSSGKGAFRVITIPVLLSALACGQAANADSPRRTFDVVSGWYVVNGKVLWGYCQHSGFWGKPSSRHGGATANLTRRDPQVTGPMHTEDLDQLTDAMLKDHYPFFEHKWGLWYDRRRDAHDMEIRTDGNAVPPFLEMPWARSSTPGAADGLNKYDLTQFNPWYFDRLDQFASLCDRKGTVMIFNFYFQHNLLENYAHYVDFPWRPTNCLQATEMQDAPVWNKGHARAVAANQFYDVTHQLRRELHELYIKKCLDELGRHRNIIFSLGMEYTGPLEFMNFWLDAVHAWELENNHKVHISLGAPKDVLDTVLQDPVRSPRISTIDLRYWWYRPDGTLNAPAGGQQVPGRYAEGRCGNETTAARIYQQLREYRTSYPDKAIIHQITATREQVWAFLMGGGSALVRYLTSSDQRALKDYVAPDASNIIEPICLLINETLPTSLVNLQPSNVVRTAPQHNWCLADDGQFYLFYFSKGGTVHLDLSDVVGTFKPQWVDPRSGVLLDAETKLVEAAKIVTLTAPNGQDWAFWLQRITADVAD